MTTYESIGPSTPRDDTSYAGIQEPVHDYEEAPWRLYASVLELQTWQPFMGPMNKGRIVVP